MKKRILLRLEHIHHTYGHVTALNEVDFNLFEGEIHALAGDHRAGKTTLGKIISGAEKKQNGRIWLNGEELTNLTIKKALQSGIGMVYQVQKNLVPSFNAIDNIYSGNHRSFFITRKDKEVMADNCEKLLSHFQVDIPLDKPLYKLGERDRQVINICHVLSRSPKILIVDDIISSLLPSEVNQMFQLLKMEKQRGTSIIYITSNLNDVFKIADRVTILQDGRRKGTEQVRALDSARLINLAFTTDTSEGTKPDSSNLLDTYQEAIIDDLPIGDIIVNRKHDVVLMNRQARRLLKYGTTPYKNRAIEQIIMPLAQDDQEKILEILKEKECESLNCVKIDDKILKFSFNPVMNQHKQRIGSNIFIEDVSFDYQTKDYLMQAKKAASVAELASGVAHEIKNPLAIIQNYVELIKLSDLDADCQGNVQHIDRELKRISEIIGSLLSFSRVNQIPFQPVGLQKTLEEVVMLLGHRFSSKNIQIIKRIAQIPLINGDENKLKQLFMNLLVNAIEAVLDEGLVEIILTHNPSDNTVSVTISDNGHGISEQIREQIFYPFFTTKMTRTNIGLGLSICQNIVELHKGVLKYSSVPGRKTSFIITFPVLAPKRDYD